jgi:hypothetical protein
MAHGRQYGNSTVNSPLLAPAMTFDATVGTEFCVSSATLLSPLVSQSDVSYLVLGQQRNIPIYYLAIVATPKLMTLNINPHRHRQSIPIVLPFLLSSILTQYPFVSDFVFLENQEIHRIRFIAGLI